MKKSIWISIVILISMVVIGISQYPKLYVATGYGAKSMASGIFLAGREADNVKSNDLDYSIVRYTTNLINYKEKSVTTTFFGLAKQKAFYRDGWGCCLVDESNKLELPLNSSQKKNNNYSWNREWPEGDARSNSSFPELDTIQLKKAIDQAFDLSGKKVKRTAAIVVAYKGKLIAEKYWTEQSITGDTRLWGWSMNKSIVNAMIGIMVKQKKLTVQALAPIVEWVQDKRRNITVNDLLQMSSGLSWNEDYGDLSDVTTMLYRKFNCYDYAVSFPSDKEAGSTWKYSSGTTNILSGIIRKSLNSDSSYFNLPYHEIFNKIGMNSMILETDLSGHFVGSSYGYATARDWAKFGQLYLQDGVWKGDSILPKGWVAYSTTPAKTANGKYGAMFWLNRSSELPDIPQDMYCCKGHRGQRIFIIPSKDLVIVRLGFAEDQFDHNLFLKTILYSFR